MQEKAVYACQDLRIRSSENGENKQRGIEAEAFHAYLFRLTRAYLIRCMGQAVWESPLLSARSCVPRADPAIRLHVNHVICLQVSC